LLFLDVFPFAHSRLDDLEDPQIVDFQLTEDLGSYFSGGH